MGVSGSRGLGHRAQAPATYPAPETSVATSSRRRAKRPWQLAGTHLSAAGTCRFGTDPATSVLDVNCKAHELDNLYVVDTSFFPSIGAVNPALTAMANALRVGEHLRSRMA